MPVTIDKLRAEREGVEWASELGNLPMTSSVRCTGRVKLDPLRARLLGVA
jgi:hypothetical protein